MAGSVIIEGVRTMAAAAAVVIANLTRCVDSNGTEGASASRLHSVAHSMADLLTLALAMTANQLGSANAD
jgi:hypothetical protein